MMHTALLVGLFLAQSSFKALIIEGQQLSNSGRFQEAVLVLDRALGDIPGDQVKLLAAVHKLRAQALESNKEYLQAIQSVQIAITYQKDSQELKQYLARLQVLSAKSVASPKDISGALQRSFGIEIDDGSEPGQSPAVVALAVNFDFEKDTLSATGKQQVGNLAVALRSMEADQFRLTGHTDTRGEAAYNDDLSLRRARTVIQELISYDIEPKRLSPAGKGSRQLITHGSTEDDHARNRRVELVVVR